MGFGFNLEIWGDYTLFGTEFKVERVSYDVSQIAPEELLGNIMETAIKYCIDKIHVYNNRVFQHQAE